jgi:hypothetical protein
VFLNFSYPYNLKWLSPSRGASSYELGSRYQMRGVSEVALQNFRSTEFKFNF